MINFACKQIELSEILKCGFNLNKTEYTIFSFLLQTKDKEIRQISKELNLERSTIQKALKNLHSKNLVKKRQINLQNGGYKFVYTLKNKEEIKKALTKMIINWTQNVNNAIKTL